MKGLKDFLYDKNDILIALLILVREFDTSYQTA